MREDQH